MGLLQQCNILIKSIRLKEILLMTGFSFIGVLFTPVETWDNWLKNITVSLFILFYVMAVYFLNSFADYDKDLQSQRLKIIGHLSKSNYFKLFVLFLILFAGLSLTINVTVFIFSTAAFLLWVLYYLPPFRLKSTYLIGTFIHFIGGILHFHTGYCSYNDFSSTSVILSVYFALLLCTGHFHHEIMDYEADKSSGNKTTAVRIGLNKMQQLRTVMAGNTLAYLVFIYFAGYISKIEFGLFLIPTIIMLIISWVVREQSVKQFQKFYRLMFLLAGLLLLLTKVQEAANTYF